REKADRIDEKVTWGREGESRLRLIQDHAVYAGMVDAMDQAVGKVMDALEELNIADNTVVIFTSDNGGLSTSEGHPTSNLPLRGGKGWLYEGGIREPLIIRWPGIVTPGALNHQSVISTDYYATIAAIAGIPTPKHDGIDLTPLLRDNAAPPERPLFWHYPHYGNQGGSPGSAIRVGDWKLIEFFEDNRVELYNLKRDLEEKHDVAKENPKVRDNLRSRLSSWRDDVGARYPAAK
ncbi:MAG TPA: DUF4976 domain-containing protein, partial [Candidatus Hydrogenedentes bacterium]|nr:DUF4976 domain-containing protein [Candidatus Hydrogenedentota bacterium]